MTFHPGCGLESFISVEWNTIVGDMLTLPEPRIIDHTPLTPRVQGTPPASRPARKYMERRDS